MGEKLVACIRTMHDPPPDINFDPKPCNLRPAITHVASPLTSDDAYPSYRSYRVEDLRRRVVRAGVSKLLGQGAIFVLRLGFLAIMARLLQPEDFGIVAMAIAFTGVYDLLLRLGFL